MKRLSDILENPELPRAGHARYPGAHCAFFGVAGMVPLIENSCALMVGPAVCLYNAVSFGVMNRQSPKGILFTTGLDEDDVVMGREDKIVQAVKELDNRYRPDMISLAATAVTSVIGLDLDGLLTELQPAVKAQLLAFSGGGFQGDYTIGIKDVFRALAEKVAAAPEGNPQPRTVNIIGPTIDTFNHPSDVAEIRRQRNGSASWGWTACGYPLRKPISGNCWRRSAPRFCSEMPLIFNSRRTRRFGFTQACPPMTICICMTAPRLRDFAAVCT